MTFFAWFWCWMFGHEPYYEVLEFDLIDDSDNPISISYCTRCGNTLNWDCGLKAWVAW